MFIRRANQLQNIVERGRDADEERNPADCPERGRNEQDARADDAHIRLERLSWAVAWSRTKASNLGIAVVAAFESHQCLGACRSYKRPRAALTIGQRRHSIECERRCAKKLAVLRRPVLASSEVRPPRDANVRPSARRRPCPLTALGMKTAIRPWTRWTRRLTCSAIRGAGARGDCKPVKGNNAL